MNCLIMLKDLFSFVFSWDPNALVCDFLKREATEEIRAIDWRRATWNGVGWPRMEVHNQLQMKEMKRKREAYWMYWIILLCSQPRDWIGCVIRLSSRSKCVIRSALDQTSWNIHIGWANILFKNSSVKDRVVGEKFLTTLICCNCL